MLTQIVGALVVAAITTGIGYAFNLEKRVSQLKPVKVQIGETPMPKKDADAFWDAAKGGGWRRISVQVTFEEPFETQPVVMVALKRFDLGDFKSNIHRIGTRAENVSLKGFQLYFETWYESLVFDAAVSWIAIGK